MKLKSVKLIHAVHDPADRSHISQFFTAEKGFDLIWAEDRECVIVRRGGLETVTPFYNVIECDVIPEKARKL